MLLRIEDARSEHVKRLAELEEQCFSLPWSEGQLRGSLKDPTHEFIVALGPGGELAGYAGMTHVLDEGYISNVAVAPDFRRQGVGDALVAALLERAEALKLSFVSLEVRRGNLPARALYAKHGFIDVGARKNYYEKPREDAIISTLWLGGGEIC